MTLSKQRRHTNSRGIPCLFETELTVVMILLHIHKVATWYTLNLPSVIGNYISLEKMGQAERVDICQTNIGGNVLPPNDIKT